MFRLPLALRSSLRRWRSLMGMVLAVSVGLASVMTVFAMFAGFASLYSREFEQSGVDLYVLQRGGVMVSIVAGSGPGTIDNARHVLAQTRSLSEVRTALGVVDWPLQRTPEGPRHRLPAERINAVGIDGDAERVVGALEMYQGRWLRSPREVVVGRKLADEKQLHVGDTLVLEQRRLEIVGIGRLRAASPNSDQSAYLAWETLQTLAPVGDRVNFVLVDAPNTAAARGQLLQELRSVDVWDRQAIVADINELVASQLDIWRIVGWLGLVISGVFVNSMLGRSIAQRRQEFGTLGAIGVPARILVELVAWDVAFVVALSSLAGIGLSRVLGALFDRVLAESLNIESLYQVDAGRFAAVFGVALAVGIVSSLLPVRAILRVNPAEVLQEA